MQDEYEKALTQFNEAKTIISKYSDNEHKETLSNIENQMGYIQENLGNKDSALGHYQNAISISSKKSKNYHYASKRISILTSNPILQK